MWFIVCHLLSGCCISTVVFYRVFCIRMQWFKIKLNSLEELQSTVSDMCLISYILFCCRHTIIPVSCSVLEK